MGVECAGVQLNSVVLALASLAGSGESGSTVKQRCVGPSEPGWEWSAREYS